MVRVRHPIYYCVCSHAISCVVRDMLVAFDQELEFVCSFVFFFNDTATTEIYTLSLHDALPISRLSLCEASMIRKQQ